MHHHVHSQVRTHQQVNILGQPLGVVMVHPMVDQEVGAGDCLPQLLIFALSKVHMPKVPQPFVLLLPKVPFKCPLLKHTCERVSGVCGRGGLVVQSFVSLSQTHILVMSCRGCFVDKGWKVSGWHSQQAMASMLGQREVTCVRWAWASCWARAGVQGGGAPSGLHVGPGRCGGGLGGSLPWPCSSLFFHVQGCQSTLEGSPPVQQRSWVPLS